MAASDCRPDVNSRLIVGQATARPSKRSPYTQSQLRRSLPAHGPMPSIEVADMLHTIADKGLELDARKDVWPLLLGVYSLDSTTADQNEKLQQLQQQYTDLLTSCQNKETQLLQLAIPLSDSNKPDSQTGTDGQTTANEHESSSLCAVHIEQLPRHSLQLEPVQDTEDMAVDELSPILFVQRQYTSWSPKTDIQNVDHKPTQVAVSVTCGTDIEGDVLLPATGVPTHSHDSSQAVEKTDSPQSVVVHLAHNTKSEHSSYDSKQKQQRDNTLTPKPEMQVQSHSEHHSAPNDVVCLQQQQIEEGKELSNTGAPTDSDCLQANASQAVNSPAHSCLIVTAGSPQLSHRHSHVCSAATSPLCRLSECKTSNAYAGSVSPMKMPSSARHVRVASDHSPSLHPSGNDDLFIRHTRLHSRTLSGQFDLSQDLGLLGLTTGISTTPHHMSRMGSISPLASVHHSRCPSHVDVIPSPLATTPAVTQDVTTRPATPMSDMVMRNSVTGRNQLDSCQQQQQGPQTPGVPAKCLISIGGSPSAMPVPQDLHDFWEAQRLIVVDAIRTDFQKHSLTATDMVSSWISAAIADTGLYQKIKASDATWAEGGWLSESARSQLEHITHLTNEQKRQIVRLIQLLSAYSVLDPEIGYCQGMSDLALPFLLICDDDAMAFWLFERLMSKVRGNFTIDDAGILGQLATLMQVIEREDPVLFQKLNEVGMADGHFAYRMIVVLMRRELPLDQALRLWEMVWADELLELNPQYKTLQLSRAQSAPMSASKQALGLRRSFPRLLLLRASDLGEAAGSGPLSSADQASRTGSVAESATATPGTASVACTPGLPPVVFEQMPSASSQPVEGPKWWQTTLDSFRTSFSKPILNQATGEYTPLKPDGCKQSTDVEGAGDLMVSELSLDNGSNESAPIQQSSLSQSQLPQISQPQLPMFAGSSLFAKLKSFSSKTLLSNGNTPAASTTSATVEQVPQAPFNTLTSTQDVTSKALDIAAASGDDGVDCPAVARQSSIVLSEAEAEAEQWGKLVVEDNGSDSKPRPFSGMMAKLSSLFSAPSADANSAGSATKSLTEQQPMQDLNLSQHLAVNSKHCIDACEMKADAACEVNDEPQQQQQPPPQKQGVDIQELHQVAHETDVKDVCKGAMPGANTQVTDNAITIASDTTDSGDTTIHHTTIGTDMDCKVASAADPHTGPDKVPPTHAGHEPDVATMVINTGLCDCPAMEDPNASRHVPCAEDTKTGLIPSSLPDEVEDNDEINDLKVQNRSLEGQASHSESEQQEPLTNESAVDVVEAQPIASDKSAPVEPEPGLFLLVVASVIILLHERIISSCQGAEDVMTVFQNLASQKLNMDECIRKAREMRSHVWTKKIGHQPSPTQSSPVSPALL